MVDIWGLSKSIMGIRMKQPAQWHANGLWTVLNSNETNPAYVAKKQSTNVFLNKVGCTSQGHRTCGKVMDDKTKEGALGLSIAIQAKSLSKIFAWTRDLKPSMIKPQFLTILSIYIFGVILRPWREEVHWCNLFIIHVGYIDHEWIWYSIW